MHPTTVAIDSNALTYFVEAIEPSYHPSTDDPTLAVERLAMIRSYLYRAIGLWVMPTVVVEYNRIRDPARHFQHKSNARVLLLDHPVGASAGFLAGRAKELGAHHKGAADTYVVAEAEAAGVPVLLTRDDDLINDLQPHTSLLLQYPSAFWASLGVPAGATPYLTPSPPNPLAFVSWWRI
jgi:hypothetical protein